MHSDSCAVAAGDVPTVKSACRMPTVKSATKTQAQTSGILGANLLFLYLWASQDWGTKFLAFWPVYAEFVGQLLHRCLQELQLQTAV